MEAEKVTYFSEISLMMFGFGDSHKPNPETIKFVESIVLDQLRKIVKEALKYSDGDELKGKELVYLMRKSKWKMRRFLKYLQTKMESKKFDNVMSSSEDTSQEYSRNDLIEFIEFLDETGELTDLSEFDEIKHERQLRADRISEALNEKKYMEFYNARCTSFNNRKVSQSTNFQKMRSWIDPEKKIKFSKCSLEVLTYYAYETVAQIMDYAFLVRMDMKSTNDPLTSLPGGFYTAAMFNREHKTSGQNFDCNTIYSGQPAVTVNEIIEVMRRVNSPQAGKLYFGKKLPENQFIFAI